MYSVCGFEGISNIFKIVIVARWLSWLERRPVTAEVVGSIPIRVALKSLRKQTFFVYKISSSYKRCRIPDIEKSLKDGILLNR